MDNVAVVPVKMDDSGGNSFLSAQSAAHLLACLLEVANASSEWPANWSCDASQLEALYSLPSADDFDVLRDGRFATVVVVFYTVVIVAGVVGNTLVVVTVAKTREMWTATNVFIVNLALADVVVCAVDLPLSAYYQLTDDWAFGAALCRLIPLVFAVVVYTSSLSLAMIAIDRYMLVLHPLRRRMSVTDAFICVVIIAVFSVVVSLPIAVFSRYTVIDDRLLRLHRRYCVEWWPSARLRTVYGVATLGVQYALPLSLTAVLYWRVLRRVARRVARRSRRKSNTTRMLVAVVLVFFTAWAPYHLYALLSDFKHQLVSGKYFKFVDAMLRGVAQSSSCVNPLLYGWLNDNYRHAFLNLLRRTPRNRSLRVACDESTRFNTTVRHTTARHTAGQREDPDVKPADDDDTV